MNRSGPDNLKLWFQVGLILSGLVCVQPEPICGAIPQFRLRVEWSGQTARLWHGLLEISDGSLSQPHSLGIASDDAGTLRVENSGVWVNRRTARTYDGFDVRVAAPTTATLSMTLQSAGRHDRFQVRIAQLCEAPAVFPIDDADGRLVISRTPGDALSVHISRPHLVYSPREHFIGQILLNSLTPVPRRGMGTLTWGLFSARSDNLINRGSRTIAVESNSETPVTVAIDVPLPDDEGVYDVRFGFSAAELPHIESQVQLIVVENDAVRDTGAGLETFPELLVDEFAPQDAGLLRTLTKRPALWLNESAFENPIKKLTRILPLFGNRRQPESYQEESDADQSTEPIDWKAYRLRVEHPGRPHRLVLSLPPGRRQKVGVSLLEPNALNQLMPIGLDSGVDCEPDSIKYATSLVSNDSDSSRMHDILFWPKVRNPVLLIHDLGLGDAIEISDVQLFEINRPAETTTAAIPVTKARQGTKDAQKGKPIDRHRSLPAVQRRLIGPYMHKPLLSENFGASEAYDTATERSLNDWSTFYTAAVRMVAYLKRQRFNSLMMGVLADGSGIYPSERLEFTPQYDNGVYFSTGQDPMRKDVLELLFRLFGRAGLVFVPELQFSTPLPSLERILAGMERSEDGTSSESAGGDNTEDPRSIELIGRDGRSWRESHPESHGPAPYYNPLDPRVQDAVLAVVRELVERYNHHDAFQGLAVEVSSLGYLQFPGLNWGYDDQTVTRFAKELDIQVPGVPAASADEYRKRSDFLTTKVRERWVRWRCEELAKFHRRLAAVVTETKDSARFILAGNRVLHSSYADREIGDVLRSGSRLDRLLPRTGLDFRLYSGMDRLVVLRPNLSTSGAKRSETLINQTLNNSPAIDRLYSVASRGSLFYHEPRQLRIKGFDTISPWQPAYTWLAAHVSPGGVENRQRFAHALAAYDASVLFDGGWMVLLGQEKPLRKIIDTLQAIPAIPFQTFDQQTQPVVVRLARDPQHTYLYAVNDFAGDVDVQLDLTETDGLNWHPLGQSVSTSLRQGSEEETQTLRISLAPYDLWAGKFDSTRVRLVKVHATLKQNARKQLKERINTFEQRITQLQRNRHVAYIALDDPGFERSSVTAPVPPADRLPDWSMPIQQAAFWTLDQKTPHSGTTALMIAPTGPSATLSSPEIPLGNHRFLTMNLWLRSDRNQSQVQLTFEGKLGATTQRQSANVRVDRQWRRYVFRVKEIPSDQMKTARIRITVLAPGKLWIDDVEIQLEDLSSGDIRQLTKVFSTAALAWEEQRYADCSRLLDSYWGRFLIESAPIPPRQVPEPTFRNHRMLQILQKYLNY